MVKLFRYASHGVSLLELLFSLSVGLPLLAALTREVVHTMRITQQQELLFNDHSASERVSLELDALVSWVDSNNLADLLKVHAAGKIATVDGTDLLQLSSAQIQPSQGTGISYARPLRAPLLKIETCQTFGTSLIGSVSLRGSGSIQADQYRSALLLGTDQKVEGLITLQGGGLTRAFAFQSCEGIFTPAINPATTPNCTAGYLVLLDSSTTLYSSQSGVLRVLSSYCNVVIENQPIAQQVSAISFSIKKDLRERKIISAILTNKNGRDSNHSRQLSLSHSSDLQFISLLP